MPRFTIYAVAALSSLSLMICSLLLPFAVTAQEKGVHFEHALSWADVKAKAKAENKYIFVDCFTTWCGPCRHMRTVIFPQEEAGNYFNDKFVSVEVQLDTTAKDNDHVKSWYADAHDVMTKYRIQVYPTYLIFAPDGLVLHRIIGSSNSAGSFISEVQQAFDTTKQYYARLRQFENGRHDSAFLRQLALQAYDAYDISVGSKVAKAYLSSQSSLFTPAALELMNTCTMRTTDEYFGFFAKHASEIDKVLGADKAENKIRSIVLNEAMRHIPRPTVHKPNWDSLQKHIAAWLPDQAQEITMRIKINYYNSWGDWPNFEKAIVSYMKRYSRHMNDEELNSIAWNAFEHCADMTCVSEILDWSRQLKNSNSPMFMDTYANILYKLGKKDEAISLEQRALDMSPGNEKSNYQSTLDKMKAGQKTWD